MDARDSRKVINSRVRRRITQKKKRVGEMGGQKFMHLFFTEGKWKERRQTYKENYCT